ncbi:sugar transferase, partial [Desulfovibrio desulfuricans]|uniref:sugar transferase n=1 Tax=Desulfovibrio desulfuricans TaxID=876 RepID=UPI0023AF4AF8
QRRIGHGGREIRIFKFRTMVDKADMVLREVLEHDPELRVEWEKDHKLKHDPRITRVGRILRKVSLDELPQLLNVVIGDMSLVGPYF